MSTEKQYRYPGTRPFIDKESNLFFGRKSDINRLHQMVRLEQLLVLFGKSGFGKSSLLNAGLLPLLKDEGNDYYPIAVRVGIGDEQNTPSMLLMNVLNGLNDNSNALLARVFGKDCEKSSDYSSEDGFWLNCKNVQLQRPDKIILLVFDQFEEIFQEKFREEDISLFARILASFLYGKMPQPLQNIIYEQLKENRNAFTAEEIELLFSKVNVQIIISIRSDKMSLLNRLKPYIPHILLKTYELKALDIDQAQLALLEPARADGDFKSTQFSFSDEAKNKILGYLSANSEKSIEAFQLQVVCQYCENLVIQSQNTLSEITLADLDTLGDLSTIFHQHYQSLLSEIDENHQRDVRIFIEERLIVAGNRVPLPDRVIDQEFHFPKPLLQKLIDNRLLRIEPNTTGGFSYELSHDTLVEPIMVSAKKRRAKEDKDKFEKDLQRTYRLQQERDQKEKDELEKENKRQAELLDVKIKAARRQKLLISVVSLIALLAIGLAVFGFYQMKQAQTATDNVRFEKSRSDSLKNEALKALGQFEAEKKVRETAQVNSLIQKANNLSAFDENELAVKFLKQALKIDSTNQLVKKRLKELEK